MMVTGELSAAPAHVIVVETPAVTLTGTCVKPMASAEENSDALARRRLV
jgi:hypothetical protein